MLKGLRISGSNLSDIAIARILDARLSFSTPLEMLDVSISQFSVLASDALVSHFPNLTTLHLSSCPNVTSAICHRILLTCLKLISFTAPRLDAQDILGVEGDAHVQTMRTGRGYAHLKILHPQAWVCTNLQTLVLVICGLREKPAEWHRLILRQLTMLVRLQNLDIGQFGKPSVINDGLDVELGGGSYRLPRLKWLKKRDREGLLQSQSQNRQRTIYRGAF
jgi:hypothetical protein